LDFVEPLTGYNEAKPLTLAEPRLRCAKQTEQLGFYSGLLRRLGLIANVHRIGHRPGASGDPGEMTGSLKKMLEAATLKIARRAI
jgi:hypothetical protein